MLRERLTRKIGQQIVFVVYLLAYFGYFLVWLKTIPIFHGFTYRV